MDRNTLLRWTLIALGVLVFWKWGMPMLSGKSGDKQNVPEETYVNAPGFGPDVVDPGATGAPIDGETCTVNGKNFAAELSTRGAAIKHYRLKDPKYKDLDLSTTPDVERWRSLRTMFRGQGASDQVAYDRFNWRLASRADNACAFVYEDETVRIEKVMAANDRPYELDVRTTVTNKTADPKKHQLSMGAYAFRRNEELKGSLGRVSPYITEVQCAKGSSVERKGKDDGDFREKGWLTTPDVDRFAAVTNYYFAQALVPDDATNGLPACSVLVEDWVSAGQSRDDDKAGQVYHAKLVYPLRELAPGAAATYKQIAFFGPKDREVLIHAAGAGVRDLRDTINLGFFTPVAKVLVWTLHQIRGHVTMGNWGLAIIAMTIVLRLLLFPLTWKSIKTTIAMRKLKPEMDALAAKFPDDPQAKNLATMELYRKHQVNPFGGCLPQLVQMPIWFAMYTTLQTAVEMYRTKFLWFDDLSAPDRLFVLPVVLGVFMIVQQRIVPQQGMDPMQQKMMTYMLPLVFTVMMLFLPAALGVYMLTNSVLGITQQLAIEKFAPRVGAPKGEIVVKDIAPTALGKGKARV